MRGQKIPSNIAEQDDKYSYLKLPQSFQVNGVLLKYPYFIINTSAVVL